MEYDVTGTLKIDTEAFEKALKEAQKKIDSFRSDLESLGNIAKEMGFPELKKSLDNVDKSLDDIKADFGKVDKSADNVTKSVDNLKKETDNATKNVKSLKNEIKQVAEEGNKVDESFEKTTKRIDELKSNLKSAYKELKNLRNEQNKIGERYSKAQKKNSDQFTYAYDFYKKGDYAKYEKEMEGYHKQEAELSKKFHPLYQDVNARIKKNREEIEKYKSEIDKLEESLERIPNSFDKIIEASKNAGQSVRDGLLKELQKSEEKLASLYKNFEKATTKIRDRPLLAHENRDDVLREEIDKSPLLKKMNDEIKRQKWYIEDLLKEWDKLGEPSAELDKKISKIERWTAGIREAEVELAKLRTSAENPENFYDDSRSGYYAKKELDSVMETLSKYDKPMEKINTRMKELKAEFSQLLDVPSVSDRNFERIRAVEKEMDKLYKRADNRQVKISKEVNEHLNSIAKEVEKSGKGMDNVTKSAENLKQATNDVVTQTEKAGESAKELDNYFDQATNSVKKTSTEVNNLQRRIEKLKMKRNFFNDFYSAVRFADGGDGIELKPVYDKLKKDYKGLVKSREEFEELFSMAVQKTNTRLYPSRNNDINVKFKSAYDRGFGYIDRRQLISYNEYCDLMDKSYAKIKQLNTESNKTPTAIEKSIEKLREASNKWDELRDKMNALKSKGASESEIEKATAEYEKQRIVVRELTDAHNKLLASQEKEGNQYDNLDKDIKDAVKTTEQLEENFDQATSSAKKLEEYIDQATASAEKLNVETKKTGQFLSPDKSLNDLNNELLDAYGKYYDLKNEAHRVREEESGSVEELKKATTEVKKQRGEVKKLEGEFRKAQDNVNRLTAPLDEKRKRLEKMLYGDQKPSPYDDGSMVGTTGMKKALTEARAEYRELLKQKKEIQAEIDKIIADNGGVLTPEITEANKELFEQLHHIDSLRQDRLEDTKSYPKEIERVQKKIEQLDKEISSYYNEAGKYLEGLGEGAKAGEEKISEFDAKLKQQFEGLDAMVKESAEQGEAQVKESVESVEAVFTKGTENIKAQIKQVQQAGEGIYKFFRSNANLNPMGKWMPPQMYTQPTNRWVHEQLSTTRNFFKGFIQGFAMLKKEQSESVTWMKELKVKMDELRYGSRDFINTEMFAKANSEAKKYLASLGRVSASTNQWVNQEITDFNRFSKAVQTSTMEAENRLKRLEQTFATMSTVGFRNDVGIGQLFSGTGKSQNMKRMLEEQLKYNKMGNATGVGFAGTKDFQNLNRQMQEYNRLSNVANLNTQRMGLGFEKFGQYSQKATSNIRSLSGVLRTLRTTMSMIGGMFVWEFAFQIMDSARATISAKSEMESYYKTLGMGSTEIASFNKQLDNTVAKFQKMNKFQLGETISALGVEFKMSTEEMNQIMKVAPMIVNEYLRAGRSTEEAILAIKDISQGEFLRLSRETGVGKTEIKEAGWSGNNKDILSLYQALEKIGKARHWDVFAMKAQSLNDVLLITENRMTEFVTLLSDAVTPVIVGSFNALGDAFNGASQWYEGLAIPEKTYVQLGTLSAVALTTAGVFNNHLLPAIQNFGTNIVSGFLGVDSVIVKEKGLAQAIAHETAVERIANIERKGGQKVLHSKIMTLKEEELANKLGMNTTKLKMRYENLQQVAMKRGTTELKARELAQRSLILAEEENITTTQAMNILLEEEALAEMGSAKALLVKKFGLDATLVSEEGMVVAMNERIAQSFPYVASLVSQTFATLGLESATATLVVTMGLLVAPFVALGLAIAPLIIQFAELQASYEKVNDVLTGGQDRIDSLTERKKELEKQEEKLANKTNRTTQESQQLDQTRKDLEGTTLALKSAEEELAKAQQFDKSRTAYTTQLQANRYKNVKKINSELQKTTGTNDEIISQTASMDRAYADMTKHMQVANYMENHRPERFEEFNKKLKEGSATQEEYNQKVKTFGNDWNEAYTQMESAQEKMANPELSGWDRFWAEFEFGYADAKMDWVEFWADPWAGIGDVVMDMPLPFINTPIGDVLQGVQKPIEEFNDWLGTTAKSLEESWDNFWQPITEFFNGLTVDASYDPFAGIKNWWGDTNAWLDSIMPNISVDGIKQWFGKNVREPFQKAFSDWMKNPFGGDNKDSKGGGTATKSISLGSLFKFNFGGFKTSLTNGFKTAIGGASQVLEGAGQLWSKLGLSDGQLTVSSIKQGLVGLKTSVTNKLNEGKKAIENQGKAWGKKAYSGAKGVLDSIKRGIGNPARIVKEKLDAITNAIKNIKDDWSGAVNDAIDSFNPFNNLSFNLPFTSGGTFGYAGTPQRTRTTRIRTSGSSRPVYGSRVSNATFEGTLRGLLTAQGFRSPSSYQFYPNHQKSVSQTWNDGSANCFDGAMLIATLGSMMGFKSRIVNGNWNGTGHSGAMVGGKLYDMTQFQRRGVFRGTQGVHFGHSGSRHYGTSTNTVSKDMHITVNVNGTVYGMADAEEKFKNIAENVFVEYHDTNKAVGV